MPFRWLLLLSIDFKTKTIVTTLDSLIVSKLLVNLIQFCLQIFTICGNTNIVTVRVVTDLLI